MSSTYHAVTVQTPIILHRALAKNKNATLHVHIAANALISSMALCCSSCPPASTEFARCHSATAFAHTIARSQPFSSKTKRLSARAPASWPQQHLDIDRQTMNGRVVSTKVLGRRALLGGLAPCYCSCQSCSHSRSSWYDSYFAFNMAHGMEEYEQAIGPLKQALFKQLLTPLVDSAASTTDSNSSDGAHILEVGIGTAPNLPYYTDILAQPTVLSAPVSRTSVSPAETVSAALSSIPAAQQQQQQPQQTASWTITGIEPNPAMWSYAQSAAEQAGLHKQQLQLVEADAQQMPFADNTFDAAVITLVLCSLPDPQAAVSEVIRVLKPGGHLLLIEHVIAPQLSWLQVQQRLLNPLQQLLADNCHLTRNTAALVQGSGLVPQPLQLPDRLHGVHGLQIVRGADAAAESSAVQAVQSSDRSDVSIARALPGSLQAAGALVQFEVEGMGLIAPHLAGILKKPSMYA